MRMRVLDWLFAAGLIGLAAPTLAQTQNQPEHGSTEQDYREERQEGLQARQQASERRRWRAPDWRPEPVVSVNILGINDFHGQLSPRTVAGRPAGGAAVLASYLRSASREYTLIVHDGDQVGASPPNSALLRDEPLVREILDAVVGAVDVPVTLKIRTGWDRQNKNGITVARIAEDAGISALSVHGRTRADLYTGEAEYETIAAIKQAVSIPVFANGDIDSPEKAKAVLDATGADALLIGRAAQGRPWIFREIEHYLRTGEILPAPSLLEVERILLLDIVDGLIMRYEQAEHKFLELVYEMGDQEDLTLEDAKNYISYLGELRRFQIGMISASEVRQNPLPWMEWMLTGASHSNFFEKRVTDYSHSGLEGEINYNRYHHLLDN